MPKVSEEYRRLYHYTTWEGLLGILKTQTLWATHYRFLNDYSELVLIRDRLIDFVFPIVKEAYRVLIEQRKEIQRDIDQMGGLDQVVQHDTASIVDAAYKATGEEIYIVSFCGEDKSHYVNSNGLLSQWRSYGIGGGIALVFESQKMEEILKMESERYSYNSGHISDVIYSDDEKKFNIELSSNIENLTAFIKNVFSNMRLKKQKALDASKALPSFIQCISRYKHRSFKEENEVRIVYLPTIHDEEYLGLAKKKDFTLKPEKERKFRTKNGKIIPYIELFDSNDIVLPVEKIIVGPHKEKNERASALRVMLRNTNIGITVSDIPYVD
jgi:hypothetical protein